MRTKVINIKNSIECFLLTLLWFCVFFIPTIWEHLGDIIKFLFKECNDNEIIPFRFILLFLAFMLDIAIQVYLSDFKKTESKILFDTVICTVLGVLAIMIFSTQNAPNIVPISVILVLMLPLKYKELLHKRKEKFENEEDILKDNLTNFV